MSQGPPISPMKSQPIEQIPSLSLRRGFCLEAGTVSATFELMKTEDLAWAAGFFDGEGTIVINRRPGRRSPSFQLFLGVGQVDRMPLDALVEIVGGNVFNVRTRGTYMWAASSLVAGDVLKLLRPYLRAKAEEARIAIEFFETFSDRGRSTSAVPSDLIAKREKLRLALIAYREKKYANSRRVGGAAWKKWNKKANGSSASSARPSARALAASSTPPIRVAASSTRKT